MKLIRIAEVQNRVPLSRSRAEQFDDMVLDAVEHLEARWAAKLESVEFAVEDVPAVPDGPPETLVWGTDVIEDGAVPLARLLPAGADAAGRRWSCVRSTGPSWPISSTTWWSSRSPTCSDSTPMRSTRRRNDLPPGTRPAGSTRPVPHPVR